MNTDAFTPDRLLAALTGYIIVIISLSAHEWGHAYAASKLGDDTARQMGRVSFNPLAHIDLVGTVLIPLFALFSGYPVVGWAKPVLVNPANLRTNAARSLVTIAGPAMNFLLALAAAIALGLVARHMHAATGYAARILIINIGLMTFNLLPVPPLDGSKFLMYWLGMSGRAYNALSRYGWFILMALFYIPATSGWLGQLIQWVTLPFLEIARFLAQTLP